MTHHDAGTGGVGLGDGQQVLGERVREGLHYVDLEGALKGEEETMGGGRGERGKDGE